MKRSIALSFLLMSLGLASSFAQNLVTSPAISFSSVPSFQSYSPSIVLNADKHQRFNQFAYNSFRANGIQVISVYEPNLRQDRVYFIDKHGNGSKWSLRPSSRANTLGMPQGQHFDSLNPTGATDIFEALTFGALNSLFSGKAAKVFIRYQH